MEYTWLSAHLFYAGNQNLLLNNLVTPLLQHTGYKAFFIRYWEGGPHIRLRIQVTEAALPAVKAQLETNSRLFFEQYPSQRDDAAYKHMPLQPNDSLLYIPYQPEIPRYGNEQSLPWAEQQFITSSGYVLQQLQAAPVWDDTVALQHAIRLNMGLLYALQEGEEMILETCRQFIRTWLPGLYDRSADPQAQELHYKTLLQARFEVYAPTLTVAAANLWKDIEQEKTTPALQTFIEINRDLFGRYRTLRFDPLQYRSIINSFMHMGHNRLGVSNLDEAYIIFFTLKCLEFIYANMGAGR